MKMATLNGELLFKNICLLEMVELYWAVAEIRELLMGYQIMETFECWEIGCFLGEFLISWPNSLLACRPNGSYCVALLSCF